MPLFISSPPLLLTLPSPVQTFLVPFFPLLANFLCFQMGNHRFRLSELIPNAWFYKLKDMNKASSTKSSTHHHPLNPFPPPSSTHHQSQKQQQQQQPPLIPSRASYYFPSNSPLHPKSLDTHFPLDSPRKSTRRAQRKPISPRPMISSSLTTSESESASNDIIIDVAGAELELELELPPIITKAPQKREEAKKQHQEEQQATKKPAMPPQGIQRLRIRANSPRLVAKKVRVAQRGGGGRQRKSLSESFAVVKNSSDPKKDFRESMMEMITENNLRASKDLEELLACYLSLNSNEYHEVIVKVFEEIWFDLTDSER